MTKREAFEKEIAKCEKRITNKVERFLSLQTSKGTFSNSVRWDIEKRRNLIEILEAEK